MCTMPVRAPHKLSNGSSTTMSTLLAVPYERCFQIKFFPIERELVR